MKKISKRPLHVAFFGDGTAQKSDSHFVDAYDTAQLLAKNKYTIVDGGGPGIMYAATLGAASIHGRSEVVVITPKNQPKKHYEGTVDDNLANSSKVFTMKTYYGRLNKLVTLAHAYVIFYGGTGTLAEMAYIWSEAKFAYPHQKPLIFFGKKWRKIIQTINSQLKLEKIETKLCFFVDKPDQVLKILQNYSK